MGCGNGCGDVAVCEVQCSDMRVRVHDLPPTSSIHSSLLLAILAHPHHVPLSLPPTHSTFFPGWTGDTGTYVYSNVVAAAAGVQTSLNQQGYQQGFLWPSLVVVVGYLVLMLWNSHVKGKEREARRKQMKASGRVVVGWRGRESGWWSIVLLLLWMILFILYVIICLQCIAC